MSAGDDDSDKSYEPTPQKLLKAREKGEVPKSNDLSVVAAYTGLLISLLTVGQYSVEHMGTGFMVLIDQSDEFARLLTDGPSHAPVAGF